MLGIFLGLFWLINLPDFGTAPTQRARAVDLTLSPGLDPLSRSPAGRARAVDPRMPSTPPRPNIVLVIADDLGQGDLSLTGSVRIRTLHLDRLGHNGSRFHGFSVASPVCSPSRAGVLTGQWPARHGIHSAFGSREAAVKDGMPPWLDPGAVLLPRLLRSAGYRTAHWQRATMPADRRRKRTVTTTTEDSMARPIRRKQVRVKSLGLP